MLQWEEEREKAGEGKANPAGPSGLPDLIPKAKDTDQDFKQNIIWLPSAEWIAGARGCCSTSAAAPGPHWLSTSAAGAGAPASVLAKRQ